MEKLNFAVLGCGFWSTYQISAWMELDNIELVAVCDHNIDKAKAMAQKFCVPRYYTDAEKLFKNEKLDFVDIITNVETHALLVHLALRHGITVICQKPMATNFAIAKSLVRACELKKVPFYIHENFRWQSPMRKLKMILSSGKIGNVFKARISFCSAFPVFENQPFLRELEQFILTDVGSHILDVVRFLLGEVEYLYCTVNSINPGIKGEDVANLSIKMKGGAHCFAELSYASILENEVFPETLIFLEGEKGSIELAADCKIKVTTKEGTIEDIQRPVVYSWVNPEYALIHSSMVNIQRNFRDSMFDIATVENTGKDNLETMKLVFAAYESAKLNKVINIDKFY